MNINAILRMLVFSLMILAAATLLQGAGCHSGDESDDVQMDSDGGGDGGGGGTKTVVEEGLLPNTAYEVLDADGNRLQVVTTDADGTLVYSGSGEGLSVQPAE